MTKLKNEFDKKGLSGVLPADKVESIPESGILFCYFESPDIIQHMFWRYTDPLHPLYEESAPKEYKEISNASLFYNENMKHWHNTHHYYLSKRHER